MFCSVVRGRSGQSTVVVVILVVICRCLQLMHTRISCQIEAVDLQVLFKQYPSGITVPSERVVEGLVAIPAAHQKVSRMVWEGQREGCGRSREGCEEEQ